MFFPAAVAWARLLELGPEDTLTLASGGERRLQYISTRGDAPVLDFDDVLLAGLASDGGLYLPESWPKFDTADIREMRDLNYAELVVRVMTPFLGRRIAPDVFAGIVEETFKEFLHSAVAPLKQLETDLWLMELFHGPTLSFKDYPMQLIGRLFDYVLAQKGERVTIVGATSGDTGSAAIEACRGRKSIDCFILYPHGRVSEVQRRQMTTVGASNVYCVAVEGTFDDCQDLVKAMFADTAFRQNAQLAAVNSINWARVAAQIVYYFHAALSVGAPDRPVSFSVPTGNFGNVFAAYAAKTCGLPVDQLIIGTNRNDILTRFFATGELSIGEVSQTISPSMDIQVSSNFERFLFDLYGRDGVSLTKAMAAFRREGKLALGEHQHKRAVDLISAHRLDDQETMAEMARTLQVSGELIDPHTAIGVAAARECRRGATPVIAQAVAHPAKFPDAVERATGIRPQLPINLGDLFEREEHFTVLANDIEIVQGFVQENIKLQGAV